MYGLETLDCSLSITMRLLPRASPLLHFNTTSVFQTLQTLFKCYNCARNLRRPLCMGQHQLVSLVTTVLALKNRT